MSLVGGPPPSPVTLRLFELLDGGEWVAFEEVIREVGKAVPPGKAIRKTEQLRVKTKGAPPQRLKSLSPERQIASGRRRIVNDTLKSHAAFVETRTNENGVKQVRMTGLPSRVAQHRARARAHHNFDPVDLADELRDGAHAPALLDELTPRQLMEIALELARRERERGRSG